MTVSRLNLLVAEAIRKEPRIRDVMVTGEVSGFRHHLASGHWYFSLKDEESAISCVMFRTNTLRAALRPRDGQNVTVTGYVDVYPKNGSYQLYVTGMRDAGRGDMYVRLEELKRKLLAEGLFDPSRKRTLPMLPRKVAVVTSPSGAALHDILNVSGMRCPSVPIVLIPVTVQGDTAAAEIAAGIRTANGMTDVDVIIVGRGGGSAEDLWCFNDERVARAVAESRIPVVSGVGHEIDTTLCDLAADVRASTPSNAAEIVFPARKELTDRTALMRQGLYRAQRDVLERMAQKIRDCSAALSLVSPERRIAQLIAGCQLMREKMNHAIRLRMEGGEGAVRESRTHLDYAMDRRMEAARSGMERLRVRLETLNPMSVLDRGYAVVYGPEHLVTRAEEARRSSALTVRFADGRVDVTVKP